MGELSKKPKEKKKYRSYKSIAFSFIDMAKEEHLEELQRLLTNKLNAKQEIIKEKYSLIEVNYENL